MTVTDQTGDRVYSFGPFLLDPVRRTLCRAGQTVPLRPKTFDVLLTLVEHRGELLDKDRFFKLVWQDTIVEENNLARHVSTLRKVLHENGEGQSIVTIPYRGYRFVAPVEIINSSVGPVTAHPIEDKRNEIPSPATPALHTAAPANGSGNRRARTLTWMGLVVALLIIASFTGTQARLPHAGERGGMPHRKLWQLTLSPGVQDEPAWSPNGEWIAYSSDRNGNADIWIQPVGQENPRRVTSSPDNDWQPAWSPDGRYIAFRSERNGGGLYIVRPDGTGERKLADFGYEPRWSADSSKILFYGPLKTAAARWGELYEVPVGGGAPTPLLGKVVAQYQWFYAAWHPSDRRISIFGARRGAPPEMLTASEDGSSIVRSQIGEDAATRIRDANVTLGRFVWAPLGDALLFEGTSEGVRNIWRIGVDPVTLAWNSTIERLTTGAELDTNISLSGDGKRLAFSLRTENTRLWSFPFDSISGRVTGPGEPFTAEGADAPYDVSSDGRRVVYRAVRHGKQELWQRTLASGQDHLLLTAASISAPRFSPDGSRLVYRRDDGSNTQQQIIATLNLATGIERLLAPPKHMSDSEIMAPFDWSADGTKILASCTNGRPATIGICELSAAPASSASNGSRELTSRVTYGLYEAQFSPDGRWVCFNAVNNGQSTIYVASVKGGDWIPITQGRFWDDKPRWSADGLAVYFTSRRRGFVNVWARRFDPERGEAVAEAFEVTTFETPARMLLPRMKQLHMALVNERMILPMTDVSASVWVLDNVNE